MFAPEDLKTYVQIGTAVAAVYAGIQSYRTHQSGKKTERESIEAKVATRQTQVEIHETKAAAEATMAEVTGNGDGYSIRKMLEQHVISEDSRLQEYTDRVANITVQLASILVLISKLEHSSNRHSEHINMLLGNALNERRMKPSQKSFKPV